MVALLQKRQFHLVLLTSFALQNKKGGLIYFTKRGRACDFCAYFLLRGRAEPSTLDLLNIIRNKDLLCTTTFDESSAIPAKGFLLVYSTSLSAVDLSVKVMFNEESQNSGQDKLVGHSDN